MTGKNGNYRENPVFPFRGQKAVDSGKRYGLRSPWSVPNFPANCAEALLPIKHPTNGSLQPAQIARGLPHREATWCGRGEEDACNYGLSG